MRAALYARVSTSDKGQDPETQLRDLREYCERRCWTAAVEYIDAWCFWCKASPVACRICCGGLETFRMLGIEFVSVVRDLH